MPTKREHSTPLKPTAAPAGVVPAGPARLKTPEPKTKKATALASGWQLKKSHLVLSLSSPSTPNADNLRVEPTTTTRPVKTEPQKTEPHPPTTVPAGPAMTDPAEPAALRSDTGGTGGTGDRNPRGKQKAKGTTESKKIHNAFQQQLKYLVSSEPELKKHLDDPVSYTHLTLPTTPYV